MTYKKVGGLHFVRLGRFGVSFFWSKARISRAAERKMRARARRLERFAALAMRREAEGNPYDRSCIIDTTPDIAGQYGLPFPEYRRYYE